MDPCIDKLLVIMYVVRFMQLESVTCMVIICVRYILSYNYVDGGLMHDMIRKAITVKPLITDPLKSGQSLYSNWFYHTTNTLQTSEKRTPLNFEQPASHRKSHYSILFMVWTSPSLSSLSTRILYLLQSTGNHLLQNVIFCMVSHISPTPILHE